MDVALRELREMWLAGGFRPERVEDAARWGDLIRDLEQEHANRSRRRERLAKWLGTLVVGLATAAAPVVLPLLMRLLGWPR